MLHKSLRRKIVRETIRTMISLRHVNNLENFLVYLFPNVMAPEIDVLHYVRANRVTGQFHRLLIILKHSYHPLLLTR